MVTYGEYKDKKNTYGVIMRTLKNFTEIVFFLNGQVYQAYKKEGTDEYAYGSDDAKNLWLLITKGLVECHASGKKQNGTPGPFYLGTVVNFEFIKNKVSYNISRYNDHELAYVYIEHPDKGIEVKLEFFANPEEGYREPVEIFPQNIPYIKLTKVEKFSKEIELSDIINNGEDEIVVRSVEEIALTKEDVTWLQKKKYFIVNDDEKAEQLFRYLDTFEGPISYDTETTGLRINCFGKINSEYSRTLEEYNSQNPDNQIPADRLVGIIFCVEPNVSYYFPCFNRKFDNLYQNPDSPVRKKIIANTKARYTIGDFRDKQGDMAEYVRNTVPEDFRLDVILMERVRDILEKKHIVAHNGSFEWKVGWLFEIDTNLKDDTMLLHQLLYKFRSTTSNRGEPSNLKYLSKVELGIDQWELSDFFPGYKEQEGEVKQKAGKKSTKSKIDFSYMTYEGTRIYAPTDGDCTLQLFIKYKSDMIKNHPEQLYIYGVEVLVACAVAYMEFYGHRIDESQIEAARDKTKANMAIIESQFRQAISYSSEAELKQYEVVTAIRNTVEGTKEPSKELMDEFRAEVEELQSIMDNDEENVISITSPAQVSSLFYDKLGIPFSGEKKSVDKKAIKALMQIKDEQGNLKYPVVALYSKYRKEHTLLTKFFDNLVYYTYPGGIIFSSYGQISTATGRMSCKKPNAQQYPKVVTSIVKPRPGYAMMDADYSQIEYRVLVAMSGEKFLADLFIDPDNDYHTLMASLMYGVPYASVTKQMRSDAKSFNFGIPYGMGLGSLAILLKGVSTPATREEAKQKYELYFKDQPNVRRFFEKVKEMAQVNRYTRTYWNRYRFYSFEDADGNVNEARKAAALRQAGNATIQGCLGGGTLIQTENFGIVPIESIVGRKLRVWDGEKWTTGDITYSGKKRKCVVTFSTGQKMVCSPIHKFLVRSPSGKDRFIECQHLRSKATSSNPHKVVISHGYSSFKGNTDKFEFGVLLGRLAVSCNSYTLGLRKLLGMLKKSVSTEEFEKFSSLSILLNKAIIAGGDVQLNGRDTELLKVVYRNGIDKRVFNNSEILRGFLSGVFDISLNLTMLSPRLELEFYNKKHNLQKFCEDIQRALLFFGIKARHKVESIYNSPDCHSHRIVIDTFDVPRFLELIKPGNTVAVTELQKKRDRLRKNRTQPRQERPYYSSTIAVESVEITDEYIDMYDVCNTDNGYYVADGVVTHNTAADIFKIAVARNFTYIRKNNLFGLMLIVNMVHDEQLFEINIEKLNMQRLLRDIGINMSFDVEGFPPLYIGAGVGHTWYEAKDKMAEIHPYLLKELSAEADNLPIWADTPSTEQEVVDYFSKRVDDYRERTIIEYVMNEENYHKPLHPAIGALLNLQFTYGHSKSKENLSDNDFTELCLEEFIKHHDINGIDASFFKASEVTEDIQQEDSEYDDDSDEDGEIDLNNVEISSSAFTLIDESDIIYGTSIHDYIKTFGLVLSARHKICGIDLRNLSYKKKEELIEFLSKYNCEQNDEGAMQIVFLNDSNVLNKTGIYVRNLSQDTLAEKVG